MDEGAGDQLDNSNLQDQAEKGGGAGGGSSNEQQSAAAAVAQQQHHHHQQQQQLNSHDQLHLQQQTPSSSSTTTKNNNNANANNTNNNNGGGGVGPGGISNTNQTLTTTGGSSSTGASSNTITTTHNPAEDLFSTKKWGVTPIRQDTPWELPPSPTSSHQPTSHNQLQQHQHHQLPSASSAQAVSSAAANNSNNATNMNSSAAVAAAAAAAAAAANQVANLAAVSASPFANHNLMSAPGAPVSMQKSMLNSTGNGGQSSFVVGGGMSGLGSSIVGGGNGNNNGAVGGGLVSGGNNGGNSGIMQQGESFARAPGPASSIMDNNLTSNKPFGMASRSSTWSAFGSTVPSEPESEWPKSTNTNSGISAGNSSQQQQHQQQQQQSGAFDLMPDFDSGKSWHGSMLMKNLDDDSSINSNSAGISAFASAYAAATSKSPSGSQYEASGIGTWSPVVKAGRPGSKWDGDGPDNGRGDNGRFDDGTAIWGSPAQNKIAGVDWVVKSGDANSNNDKSRSMAGNNQNYRPQQSSSSTSLLMSSNTSPSSQQHNRNPQTLKQPILSHNFDQVQQQSNALSSQPNQPNRATGLSNVPSTQQLKHMVQQIQLAVQAGHLNPQILNQPLAPVTLQLLYQLLQQIKVLHQLQMTATQQFNKPGSHPATVNVHITKTKQSILNLQNQIAAQQAAYLKQTQHNISSRQPAMPNLATGGMGGGMGPALPPGISQSGDSFRSGTSVNDFAHGPAMVNNFGVDSMNANGLANSLGHMNLGGGGGVLHSSRFDQPWRAPAAKQHQQPPMASSSPFANHNLMNPGGPSSMQKSMLNSSGNGGSSFGGGMQQGESFARAPGPASSIMDNNMASNKPFGMASRSSTWSAFGSSAPNEPDSEWPKSTTSGFSMGNSTQPSNAFDLVPEFEPGKPWRGSMLMKSVEDDPTMTPGSMARSLAPQRKTIWSDEVL